ncbi:MAG: EAL domain-containing protein, partial [Lachnospiraceae bacterium]|nr:EAL domain-containing protein [Lachnospiraceae bacterium]
EFIPLAEKNGLMDDITWIVLEKVCRFFAENRELPIGQISVNMACQQLLDLRFEERLRKLCSKYKVGPEKLRIEITERTMVEDPQRVREIMMNLGEMGIRFYLDDFGIGYSNLAMMLEMPFETVKLDSSLIANITKGERKCHTVKLLVELLHNSGLIVVAEGIEEEKENQTAKELTIDMIQGFYHARPMPGDAYVAFLKERNPGL